MKTYGKQVGKLDELSWERFNYCFYGLSGKIKSYDLLWSASSFFLDPFFVVLDVRVFFVFSVYKSEITDRTFMSLLLQSSDLGKITKI